MMQKGGRRAKKQFKFNNGTGGAVILFNRLCSYFYFEMLYMVSKALVLKGRLQDCPALPGPALMAMLNLFSTLDPDAKEIYRSMYSDNKFD